jgi:protein-disulfide isomerase
MLVNQSGVPIIVASVVLALGVLGGALLISRSVDRASEQLGAMQMAMGELQEAVEGAEGGEAAAPVVRPTRRRGPDPNRRYEIDTAGAPAKGPKSAPVVLVEYSDFQCPFCARVHPTLEQVEREYGDKVRIVFKHLPLSIHPKAPAAHAAAQAAALQGKFWEMHDKIFENQREMSEEKYVEWAGELGLDVDRFKRDVASAKVRQQIESDKREAAALGVSGTPSFFVNGRFLSGAQPFSEFKQKIDEALAG